MSFTTGTFIFVVLEVLFVGYVFSTSQHSTKENKAFKYLMFSLAVFCCWMMWALMYLAQMHPLIKPVLEG